MKINYNGIDRDMTDEELAEYKETSNAAKIEQETQEQEKLAQKAAREAALAKLGLTADEIAALFG